MFQSGKHTGVLKNLTVGTRHPTDRVLLRNLAIEPPERGGLGVRCVSLVVLSWRQPGKPRLQLRYPEQSPIRGAE